MKVLVVVGTHEQPFQRLLAAVERGARDLGEQHQWLVQRGVGTFLAGTNVNACDYMTADEIHAAYKWADIVVAQASPGIIFSALEGGAWPIVLGRQKCHGEHVDDHQVAFAALADKRGWATNVQSVNDLPHILSDFGNHDFIELSKLCNEKSRAVQENGEKFREGFWAATLSAKYQDLSQQ